VPFLAAGRFHSRSIQKVIAMASEHARNPVPYLIQAKGTFDAAAAEQVARALERSSPDARVRVDLTQVRDFQDLGVAVLARALQSHRRVEVSGLRLHQLRLLKYLGVDASEHARHA
jgi:anti-anti-sigma regulatory factor